MRFDSSEIGGQFTELVAYGTAVIVRAPGQPEAAEAAEAASPAGA